MASDRARLLATAALVGLTAIWGSTFFLVRDLVQRVAPADFLAVRFSLAAVLLTSLAWRQVRALPRQVLWLGAGLGALYGAAQIVQTIGLVTTDASLSGFVTGTYVVLTPLLSAVVLRERLTPLTWVAVLLATAGLGVLSLRGMAVSPGVLLTLAAAGLYAGHIVVLGHRSRPEQALGLSAVQMVVIALMCVVVAVPGGIQLPATPVEWWTVAYIAVAASIVALLLQTWAQAHMSATRAAIIMTLEPVFAALFAVWFGGEHLTVRMWFGGALVLAAMYLVELVPRTPADTRIEVLHHEV
jgi:drug/metabolite transporter (DMT)-like permease